MAKPQQTELVAQAYRALQTLMPGFIARQQQKSMISRCLGLMTQTAIGLIEAPTGTGKSMGYLIPGIASAVTQDKVLIVSTATASLQDQLASKDIPLALKAFEQCGISGIKVVVAKGRERHACPLKMEEFSTSDMFTNDSDTDDLALLSKASRLWQEDEWNGVRDSLPIQMPMQVWKRIANTAASCSGQQCPSFKACPHYKTQAELKNARVIITNHDYLLSTLSNVPNSVFSHSERNIFVFDEAHHLGDKLLSVFAQRLDLGHFWKEEIKAVLQLCPQDGGLEFAADIARGIWLACEDAAHTILGDGNLHRFTLGEVPPQFKGLLNDLKGGLSRLRDSLKQAKEAAAKGGGARALLLQGRLGQLGNDIDNAIACIEQAVSDEQIARWLSRSRQHTEINCSPFDAASKARQHLWPVVKCAVLTSATFTSMGSFDAQRQTLGLAPRTSTLRLDSPFDYSRAKLIVPPLCVEATNPAHSRIVAAFLKDYAVQAPEHQGILVYFTSRKLMQECLDSIPFAQRDIILVQGQWQPWAMIAEHKRRIDAGQRSILFGMDSLGEGVDLPGSYCTRVIMTRLPFPSPDDPVLSTHAEHLQSQGKDPFHLLTMPKAGLKFAQVAGRLMRREQDWGDFFVLDKRLRTKRYGSQLLKSTAFARIEAA